MNPVGAWAPAGWETEALRPRILCVKGGPCALDTGLGEADSHAARAEVHIRDGRPACGHGPTSPDAGRSSFARSEVTASPRSRLPRPNAASEPFRTLVQQALGEANVGMAGS